MTFKYGTSTTRMKGEVKPVIVSKDLDLGKIEIMHNGSKITAYNIERTLVDLLKTRYNTVLNNLYLLLKNMLHQKIRI